MSESRCLFSSSDAGEGVFEIASSGRIVAIGGARFELQKQMEALGTLDRVKHYVNSLPTQGQ